MLSDSDGQPGARATFMPAGVRFPFVLRRLWFAPALALFVMPVGAVAQVPDASSQFVRVAAISPWIDPAHPLSMTVQVANTTEVAMENVSIRVSVFSSVGSRSALREVLDSGPRSGATASTLEPVEGSIAPGEQRTVTLQRTAQSFGAFSRTGVYPIGVTLRHSGIERTLYTALPYFASPPQAPINVTWVLPVSRPPATSADGVYEQEAVTALRLSELAQQLNVIARRAGLQVTLAPSG
ncbi:MAG TPA: DUF6049 family protein, partial [Actinomycetota bacterium]|nr:DUF6049 family protein [Actinomycetota bacterium]